MEVTRVQQILTDVLADSRRVRTLPESLCAAGTTGLPISGVGLILVGAQGRPEQLVAATDGPATTMEELQFSLGEGPCIDSSRQGRPVLQPELRHTGPLRWPAFGPAAVQAGIEAIFALPLHVGGIRLGVLDLYRDVAGTLSPAELREALAFADAATSILLHLQDRMSLGEGLHPDLDGGTPSRAEIHQATGMVAVQAAVGLTEALLLLRANAYATERRVLEVARDVLSRVLHFAPEDDHHE